MEEWQDPEIIRFWIFLGILFLVVLLVFIIVLTRLIIRNMVKARVQESNMKLKTQLQLTEATIKAQEIEKERIASDLHDELIGKLNGIKLNTEIGLDPSNYDITKEIEDCISTARRISHDLSPPLIEYSSLIEIIDELLEPYRCRYEVIFESDVRVSLEVDSSFKVQLLRIVQETLMNIHKHSQALRVYLRLKISHKGMSLLIQDDGKGFNKLDLKPGLGLQNIETRTQYLGGFYKLRSVEGKGSTSFFYIPTSLKN